MNEQLRQDLRKMLLANKADWNQVLFALRCEMQDMAELRLEHSYNDDADHALVNMLSHLEQAQHTAYLLTEKGYLNNRAKQPA